MDLNNFAKKFKISNRDKKIVKKIYGNKERTEAEFIDLLKDKVSFKIPKPENKNVRTERVKEKIQKKRENKTKASSEK